MRTRYVVIPILVAAFCASGLVLVAHEGEEHPKAPGAITVHGEILDMACYVAHKAKGEEHADCAKRCVKGGQPMGLLAADGTVYLLYANHKDGSAFEQAKDHAGRMVQITGVEATQDGIKGIEVSSVKAH